MCKERVKNSPVLCLLCLLLIALCLIGVQMLTGNTLVAVSIASALSVIFALLGGATVLALFHEVLRVLKGTWKALAILAAISFTCGVWLRGGLIATMLYWTAKLCTPKSSLCVSFLACALMAYITGSSFSTISSMGVVSVLVSVGFGLSRSAAIGAVVSGAVLGNKMSPVSDTISITCSLCKVDAKDHRKAMRARTLLATVITAVMFASIGLTSRAEFSPTITLEMCRGLEQSFQISLLSLLPLGLLVVLTYSRVDTLQNLLICVGTSLATAAVSQKLPLSEVLRAGLCGFQPTSAASGIVQTLSGGGLAASIKTLLVITLTSAMGGILSAGRITPVLFQVVMKQAKNDCQLSLFCHLLSLGILAISGNQMLAIVMMTPVFLPAFERTRYGRLGIAGLFADTTVVAGSLLPWSAMHLFTAQVFSLRDCEHIPYLFFCILSVVIAFIQLLLPDIRHEIIRYRHP